MDLFLANLSKFICIFGIFAIFFNYIGFPFILFLLNNINHNYRLKKRKFQNNEFPEIQVVIACFNEANYLEKRIDNILKQNYPKEKIKILIISDGSTDNTKDIVQKIIQENEAVRLFALEANYGKNIALNEAFQAGEFRSSLLCFTDADSAFEPGALAGAAEFFANPRVGLVGGNVKYWLRSESAHRAEGFYWRLENLVREAEGDLGVLVSSPGQFVMMRRGLFQSLPPESNTDFAMPLSVLSQGFETRFAKNAKVKSFFPTREQDVYRRRKRTIIRALATIAHYKKSLPWRLRHLLFWHKTVRFYMLPVQGLVLLANMVPLTIAWEPWWALLLCFQALFYGFAALGWLSSRFALKIPLVHLPYQFTVQNWVAFGAVVAFLRGERVAKWTPPREPQQEHAFR